MSKNNETIDNNEAMQYDALLPTVPAREVLKKLHQIIDSKFKRTDRAKKVNPNLLETKMTLWSLVEEFKDTKPEDLSVLLRELVDRDSVVTNLNEEGVYPFDAYFIPKTELIDKKQFQIYAHVKSILHGG
jgi:hypothetical protein